MENKEYKVNHVRPGGRRGNFSGEKAKDLVGTWKKLFGYCRKYIAVIILALVCAASGTVLTLIGPDKLSEMTDTITAGIKPDEELLGQIMTETAQNIASSLSDAALIEEKTEVISSSDAITDEDKKIFFDIMKELSGFENPDLAMGMVIEMPSDAADVFFDEITVSGTQIPGSEQIECMRLMQGMENEGNAINALDDMPESVKKLIKPSIDIDKVKTIAITLVIMYGLSWLFSAVQGFTMSSVTQHVSKRMRSDISEKINRLPMWFYNKTSTGDVLSRVTNDVDTIGTSLNQSLSSLVHAIILFVGSFIMMLITDRWMTLTAVLASVLGFVLMFAIMGRSQKYFARQQRCLGDLNGHIEEIYTGHTVVKAYNGEESSGKVFDDMNAKLQESGFKAQCLAGCMQPLMGFIGNLGYVAVCVVGGAMALNGKIGFGVIVAFIMYVRYFTQPLSQIAQAMQSMQSAAAAGERVFEFLEAKDMEDESDKSIQLKNTEGCVEFKHVKFGYEDSDVTVIKDFSAVAKPGQKIAIVGPTGAGKTTMVNLLMRFHEIQSGEILIDGVSTKDMTREEVHNQFCMVLQDTWLFEGTVKENLVYCAQNVSDEKIKKACKAVGLDHFIRTLPKGYDTVLNDRTNLSQGQKQQLTIARAMIADKPMLILDEATSSVDTRTEQQIQAAMDKLMENRTSFVIAHRLSTIKNSDLILVMKEGDIIESGTHEQLIEKNGFYAELYNSQFEEKVS